MKYVRLCAGLEDRGQLFPKDDIFSHIKDVNKDWYVSVYHYTTEHYNTFLAKGTIAGITEVTTNRLIFDFDVKSPQDDLNTVRADILKVTTRLAQHGIKPDEFVICYSGSKGFSIEIETTNTFSPKQLKTLATRLAGDLKTFDSKVYNPSRIFRVPKTKHNTSGLFKIPITLKDLSDLPIETIRDMAKTSDGGAEWTYNEVTIPDSLLSLTKDVEEVVNLEAPSDVDLSKKPKWLSPCKYMILNGHFQSGNRNHALMALGATVAAQGFPKEVTRNMLEAAAELQARRTNTEQFSSAEIDKNIIGVIYGPNWKGATYACKDHAFLQEICPVKGTSKCHMKAKERVISIDSVTDEFEDFAKNIDNNTIKSGITLLDNHLRLMTNSLYIVAGSAGSGKTSLLLNILHNTSKQGLISLFGSADMSSKLVYQKIAQNITRLPEDKLFKKFKFGTDEDKRQIRQQMKEEFDNVLFDFRRSPSLEEIREVVLDTKNKHPDTFKLFAFDYIGKISGPYSDDTANMAYVAPKLADLADEANICLISLAQVARSKGGPSTPFTDSRIAKGSGAIEEAATAVLGLWRPGYNTENDNYISIAGLKMRMGKEFLINLGWEGSQSHIYELSAEQEEDLELLLESQQNSRGGDGGWG